MGWKVPESCHLLPGALLTLFPRTHRLRLAVFPSCLGRSQELAPRQSWTVALHLPSQACRPGTPMVRLWRGSSSAVLAEKVQEWRQSPPRLRDVPLSLCEQLRQTRPVFRPKAAVSHSFSSRKSGACEYHSATAWAAPFSLCFPILPGNAVTEGRRVRWEPVSIASLGLVG